MTKGHNMDCHISTLLMELAPMIQLNAYLKLGQLEIFYNSVTQILKSIIYSVCIWASILSRPSCLVQIVGPYQAHKLYIIILLFFFCFFNSRNVLKIHYFIFLIINYLFVLFLKKCTFFIFKRCFFHKGLYLCIYILL